MTWISILQRTVAMIVGAVILAAITDANIIAAGGYDHQGALLMAAQGLGVFVACLVVGSAWQSAPVIAVLLGLSLLAGEAYNYGTIGERTVTARDAAQSVPTAAAEAIKRATANVEKAERAPVASARLTLAQKAHDQAKDDVSREAANVACKKECQRKQALADAASAEVRFALAEAEIMRATAISTAKAELAALPPAQSATPLADRTGVAAWRLDLLFAGLATFSVNGLAMFLVAFAAHGGATMQETVPTVATEFRPLITVADEPAIGANHPANDDTDLAGVSDFELARVAALFKADIEPKGPTGPGGGGKVIRPRRWQRDDIRADLTARLERGERWPSQRAMASAYGVPASTLCEWFGQWAREGDVIKRTQVGRRKAVG